MPLTGHDSSLAGSSLALQALYANDSVKHPLADITLDDSDDRGNGHEDNDWGDGPSHIC